MISSYHPTIITTAKKGNVTVVKSIVYRRNKKYKVFEKTSNTDGSIKLSSYYTEG